MMTPLKLAIAGAAGRMGRQLIGAALDAGHDVTGGTERSDSADLATDIGLLAGRLPIGRTPLPDIVDAAAEANTWIDFTTPTATLSSLERLAATPVKTVIIGTTGFSADEREKIASYADRFALVQAGNFSLGIALMTRLTELAAKHLDQNWDIEILETHHRHKIDAPSGTALMLGEAAAWGRDQTLDRVRSAPYDGPDTRREAGKVGFSVRRSGGVIGEHDASFSSATERLSISHTALDRGVFADGAIKAAEWASAQANGLYTIHDVLGV